MGKNPGMMCSAFDVCSALTEGNRKQLFSGSGERRECTFDVDDDYEKESN